MEFYWPVAIIQEGGDDQSFFPNNRGPHPYWTSSSCTLQEAVEWFEKIEQFGPILIALLHDNDMNLIAFESDFPFDENDLEEGMYCSRTIIKTEDNNCQSYTTHNKYENLDDAIKEINSIREEKPTIFSYVETIENGTKKIVFWENYLNFIGRIEKPRTEKRR